MRSILTGSVWIAALCLLVAGCGDGRLRTQGKVVMDGKPLIPKMKEAVHVIFVPILPGNELPRDHYTAVYNREAGTFWSAGKDKKGMPPGKYRVAVEYLIEKQDVFKGRFDEDRSPFVFDVDASTKELVIDLDAAPKE